MADAPTPPPEPDLPATSKAPEPKYLTWELPAAEGQAGQEAQIVRECDAKGADRISTPQVYSSTKTLRRWRVQVR